jgi:three-Cys-motif partner protein
LKRSLQRFGDSTWTQDKLTRVRKYLVAYSKIMAKLNYRYAYVDGFAGTGYHELKQEAADGGAKLLPELEEPEVAAFLDGSAKIALQVEPRFTEYIFIEKSRKKVAELEKLKLEFPDKRDSILIETAEANAYLQKFCRERDWRNNRAVLFIDPFGMQLSWDAVRAIGQTEAVDTWILFPVSAVNRLLKRDMQIPEKWKQRLDTMFGEPGWFDVFFPEEKSGLFGDRVVTRRKTADMARIGKYFNDRLTSVFADVAPNPYTLKNTRGCPLFLLCFAAANPNPKASKLAIKIAQDILKRDPETSPMLPMMD